MGKVNVKFKKAEARILSLLELEDGWDYGEGVKIDEDNVWLKNFFKKQCKDRAFHRRRSRRNNELRRNRRHT